MNALSYIESYYAFITNPNGFALILLYFIDKAQNILTGHSLPCRTNVFYSGIIGNTTSIGCDYMAH